jgi:hypothetical protein
VWWPRLEPFLPDAFLDTLPGPCRSGLFADNGYKPQNVANLAHTIARKESRELRIAFATVAQECRRPRNRRRRFGPGTASLSTVGRGDTQR